MPVDEWGKETRRIVGQRSSGVVVLPPDTNDERADRAKVGAESAILILAQFGARLDMDAKLIRITIAGDPETELMVRQALNGLDYNVRKGKANPVQMRGGEITVDAVRFARKCEDKGWDCKALISDEHKAVLLGMNPESNPRVAEMQSGGKTSS
ncbi:MAG: hypothetical protein K2Q01_01140 [Rickettsiales bacterium]|nr:hypothetical protein [Rickettsiales bacterium]